jgi:glutathione S-transferase
MKLYFMPGTCSLSPHIVFHELGLPFEAVQIDRKNKHTPSGQDYRAINPKGSVPAIETDDGQVLTEGAVIVQFLADQKPELKLAPAFGTMDRVRLQEWLNYIASEIHKGYSPLFSARNPDDVKEAARDHLRSRFAFLEAHFEKHDYLLNDAFSVADAYLFTVMRWAAAVKLDLTNYPKLKAFQDRIAARPAVQAAMKAERLIR